MPLELLTGSELVLVLGLFLRRPSCSELLGGYLSRLSCVSCKTSYIKRVWVLLGALPIALLKE